MKFVKKIAKFLLLILCFYSVAKWPGIVVNVLEFGYRGAVNTAKCIPELFEKGGNDAEI